MRSYKVMLQHLCNASKESPARNHVAASETQLGVSQIRSRTTTPQQCIRLLLKTYCAFARIFYMHFFT